MIKRTALMLTLFLLAVATVVLYRAYYFTPETDIPVGSTNKSTPQQIASVLNTHSVATHLSEAIRFPTVSYEQHANDDPADFTAFIRWLAHTYPLVHKQLSLQYINNYTLLYKWQGQQSESAVLLSAHYDVVPVNPHTESDWTHPPFSGAIANGYIWGRGALDNKSAAIALMEATTVLLKTGFHPQQDIYIALTHDQETGSQEGAQAITEKLQSDAVNLLWSLDEGSFVLDAMTPGNTPSIASTNIAEKGDLALELVAQSQGRHSTMPQEKAVNILAAAIVKLKEKPAPGGLIGLSEDLYIKLDKHMDFGQRVLFANSWLFKPFVDSSMDSLSSDNLKLRTTAKVNVRLHPQSNVASLINRVRRTIDDDRIGLQAIAPSEASLVSSTTSLGFAQSARQTRLALGDVIVMPAQTIAATDSRFYSQITDTYRFSPMVINQQDLAGFHGVNERISIDNMARAVTFYAGLMQTQ